MYVRPRRHPRPAGPADPGRARQSLDPFRRCHLRDLSRATGSLDFDYTPKHVSWLNMVAAEIGALCSQRLERRVDDRDELLAPIGLCAASSGNSAKVVPGPKT